MNVHNGGDIVDDQLLLTHQLQRLLVCLDVYLETSQSLTNSKDFSLERICSRLARYQPHLSVCLSVWSSDRSVVVHLAAIIVLLSLTPRVTLRKHRTVDLRTAML